MIPVFLLTYNEADFFVEIYNDEFVNQHFKPNDIYFYVLDNGNQPKMQAWCQRHGYTYYASEYNIGGAGGTNWAFKTAHVLGLKSAIFMQADVEVTNAWPLMYTYDLTKQHGETHFVIWPMELKHPPGHPNENDTWQGWLPNLGNLVGYNPEIMHKKDCYFDENYVVTHFDDVEFIGYCHTHNKMKMMLAHEVLGDFKQCWEINHLSGVIPVSSFKMTHENGTIKVHHASRQVDAITKNIPDSHLQWHDFNLPYYNFIVYKRDYNRLPYDASRWQKFGYPKYPVLHEMSRFFEQNPDLIVNKHTHNLPTDF